MALLSDSELGPSEKKDAARREITSDFGVLHTQMSLYFARIYVRVYADSRGLTPKDVAEAMGQDAATLFYELSDVAESLDRMKPGTVAGLRLPRGHSYEAHEDGTVTIGEPLPFENPPDTTAFPPSSTPQTP